MPFIVEADIVHPAFQGRDATRPFRATSAIPRIAVFGESSVRAGSQIPITQEFPALLQQRLFAEGRTVEVLNLGRSGADSHTIRRIVEASLEFDLDAAVLYLGHNDVGNAFFAERYGTVTTAGGAHLRAFLHRWHTYCLLRDLLARPDDADAEPGGGTGGLSAPRLAAAATDFSANLALTVRGLLAHDVRVLLATPVSRASSWDTPGSGCPEVVSAPLADGVDAESAVARAPDCPEALFLRGSARQRRGELAAGWADLHAARDRDRRPLRATTGIVEAVRDAGRATGIGVVDLAAQQEERPATASADWFKDPVHLSPTGHQEVAARIRPALEPLLR